MAAACRPAGHWSTFLTLPYGVDATQLDQCVTQVGSGPQLPAVVAQLKPSGTTATRLFLPWLVVAPMPLPLPVPHACGEPGPARYLSAHVKRRHGPASTVRMHQLDLPTHLLPSPIRKSDHRPAGTLVPHPKM
jgi:hypothetical protein